MELKEDLSSTEIGTIQDEKEKELRVANEKLALVEEEDLRLSREILLLQIARKDNGAYLSKAKHNVRRINSELRQLKHMFWTARNSGT